MGYRVVVLLKQVPDIREITSGAFNVDGTLKRNEFPLICNPSDMMALEMALKFKDTYKDVVVSAVSMGPDSAADVLMDAMYRGADDAILLSDRAFAGADTLSTSRTIAKLLKRFSFDIIFCGNSTLDGGTSQVGPSIAEFLNIPDVSSVLDVRQADDKKGFILALKDAEIRIDKPFLCSVSPDAPKCRYRNIRMYKSCRNLTPLVINASKLGLSLEEVGSNGSGTIIDRINEVSPKKNTGYEMLTVCQLADKLCTGKY